MVWVNEEERIERATQLLAVFRANPTDPKYQAQARSAEELRAEKGKNDFGPPRKPSDAKRLRQILMTAAHCILQRGAIRRPAARR